MCREDLAKGHTAHSGSEQTRAWLCLPSLGSSGPPGAQPWPDAHCATVVTFQEELNGQGDSRLPLIDFSRVPNRKAFRG